MTARYAACAEFARRYREGPYANVVQQSGAMFGEMHTRC